MDARSNKTSSQLIIEELLAHAGITLNGSNPWDPQIYNPKLFDKILAQPELGAGEAYMDHWWDCEKLDMFFARLLRANIEEYLSHHFFKNKFLTRFGLSWFIKTLTFHLFNYQKKSYSFIVGEKHYDIGNDLFSYMLDKELNYSCGYWQHANNLEEAQIAKLKLICEKLHLKPGQRILDIGCGWGSFARFATKNYQVSVVGVTISKRQKELGDQLNQGLPIEIRLQDYRDLLNTKESFDHIVSIGMFEHVGYKNYATFMQTVQHCLKDEESLCLLHTIGSNVSTTHTNAWFNKYIFPNSMLPSTAQIGAACESRLVIEDWHNFGAHYDKTLMAWHHNFNQHWPQLKTNYDDRFKRMWDFYLLSSAGSFRARSLQLWQIVLSKKGMPGGYTSVR